MATAGGPNIETDGLVLALDASNIKSFRGEPTVNLKTSGQDARFNYGTGQYIFHGLETTGEFTGCYKITATSTSGNRLIMALNGISATANTQYTATIEWVSPNNSLSFEVTGNQGAGVPSLISGNRYAKTFTKNSNPGSMHFYLRSANGAIGSISNGIIYYRNIQWEQKSYATPFVNGTRGTTVATGGGWADKSGNNNHGELVNGPTFDSENGGSIVFDGVNDIIITNRTLNTNDYSVEFVFKTDVNTLGVEHWLGSQYPGTGRVIFDLWTNNKLRNFNNGTAIYGNTLIDTDTWYHVIFTRNSSGLANIYLNGKQEATGTISTTLPVDTNFEIGASTTLSRGFTGAIPITKIYNRTLTAEEILQNYNATKSRFNL